MESNTTPKFTDARENLLSFSAQFLLGLPKNQIAENFSALSLLESMSASDFLPSSPLNLDGFWQKIILVYKPSSRGYHMLPLGEYFLSQIVEIQKNSEKHEKPKTISHLFQTFVSAVFFNQTVLAVENAFALEQVGKSKSGGFVTHISWFDPTLDKGMCWLQMVKEKCPSLLLVFDEEFPAAPMQGGLQVSEATLASIGFAAVVSSNPRIVSDTFWDIVAIGTSCHHVQRTTVSHTLEAIGNYATTYHLRGIEIAALTAGRTWMAPTSTEVNISHVRVSVEPDKVPAVGPLPKAKITLDPEVVCNRFSAAGVNMAFEMNAIHADEVVDTKLIGRTWPAFGNTAPMVFGGQRLPGIKPIPAPAYAGLTRGVADQNVMRSLTALSSIYGNVKEGMISDVARTSINRLLGRPYQPCHLMLRLAALYVASYQLETVGRTLTVVAEIPPEEQAWVSGWNSFSRQVYQAERRNHSPIPFLPRACTAPEAFYRVLVATVLGTDALDCDGDMPVCLRVWPLINNPKILHFTDAKVHYSSNGACSSSDVAMVISFFANTFGLEDIVHDTVRFMFMMSHNLSSNKNDATLAGCREMLDIGESDTGAFCLIHLLQPQQLISHEQVLAIFDDPEDEHMGGIVRSMVFNHCINMVLASAGGALMAQGLSDAVLTRNLSRIVKDTGGQQPLTAMAWKAANTLIGETASSRLLSRYKLCGRNLVHRLVQNYRAGHWVQSEELIPVTQRCLTDTALLGYLTPAAPTSRLDLEHYYSIAEVVGADDKSAAFYSLLSVLPNTNIQLLSKQHGCLLPKLQPHTKLTSYRGHPLDGQFVDLRTTKHSYTTVFRLDSGNQLHRATTTPAARSKYRWWYDWYAPSQYSFSPRQQRPPSPAAAETEHSEPIPRVPSPADYQPASPGLHPTPEPLTAKNHTQVFQVLGAAGTALQSAWRKLGQTESQHDASTASSLLVDTLRAMDPGDVVTDLAEHGLAEAGISLLLDIMDLAETFDSRTATAQRLAHTRLNYQTALSNLSLAAAEEKQPMTAIIAQATSIEDVENVIEEEQLSAAIAESAAAIVEAASAEAEATDKGTPPKESWAAATTSTTAAPVATPEHAGPLFGTATFKIPSPRSGQQ